MKEITAYFRKLESGDMAVLSWPDITFPTSGFEPKEGMPYTCLKVRHPEMPRFEYEGRNYVVCTATPVQARQEISGMGKALAELGL